MEASNDRVPPVEITLTSDGLRMQIFDREDTPLFLDNRSELTNWGQFLMQNLSWLLSRYPFRIVIEAHSGERDADFARQTGAELEPWDLSVDRAQEIRRQLTFYAAGDLEVRRVSGYGDSDPLPDGAERGRTHQRVSLSLSLSHQIDADAVPAADGEDL
jgi:chemotaxis protein MotB